MAGFPVLFAPPRFAWPDAWLPWWISITFCRCRNRKPRPDLCPGIRPWTIWG